MDEISYTIRMPRDVKNELKNDAEKQGRSLNRHFVHIIKQYLDGELIPVKETLENPRTKKLIKQLLAKNI